MLADRQDAARLLLDNGADASARNEAGHQPADYARQAQFAQLLKDNAKKVSESFMKNTWVTIE